MESSGADQSQEASENMTNEHIYTLVASSNHGRYAGDDPAFGPDLMCGRAVAVLLGGQWVAGSIEGSRHPTSLQSQGCYVIEEEVGLFTGYYFLADSGEVCGLCTDRPNALFPEQWFRDQPTQNDVNTSRLKRP